MVHPKWKLLWFFWWYFPPCWWCYCCSCFNQIVISNRSNQVSFFIAISLYPSYSIHAVKKIPLLVMWFIYFFVCSWSSWEDHHKGIFSDSLYKAKISLEIWQCFRVTGIFWGLMYLSQKGGEIYTHQRWRKRTFNFKLHNMKLAKYPMHLHLSLKLRQQSTSPPLIWALSGDKYFLCR